MQNWIDLLSQPTQEMLYQPLAVRARAAETNSAFLHDPEAIELCLKLNLPGRKNLTKVSRIESHRIAARAVHYDQIVRRHLQDRPDLVVVNLGAALDTRFYRVDNGRLRWYDIDMPDVIHFRRQHLPLRERVTELGLSPFDPAWPHQVVYEDPGQLLFLAENLFAYHQESEIRRLLELLASAFPGASLCCDIQSRRAKRGRPNHPFVFLLDRAEELKHLEYRLRISQIWPVGSLYVEKQPQLVRLRNRLPAVCRTNQIMVLTFNEPPRHA